MKNSDLLKDASANTLLLVIISCAIIFQVKSGSCIDIRNNLQLRYDTGLEVDPSSADEYPDNLTNRNYFEGLLTTELLSPIPIDGGRLRLSLRFLEFNPSKVDGEIYGFNNERRLDKIYAQLRLKRWEFWIGDVYETFGRGLSLYLFEDRDLYFDSGLRGGKVTYRSKKVRFKTILGESREWYLIDNERLGGINLEYRPLTGFIFGGNFVFQEGLTYNKRFMQGIYNGFEIGPFSLYCEYAHARSFHYTTKTGDGIFIGMDAGVAGVAAQFNYKYYNFGTDNPFQLPPIVQREYTTHMMSAQHPHEPLIDDQLGFELDLSASPYESMFLNLNFSRASKHKGRELIPSLKEEYAPFWEAFMEGEYYACEDLTLKFGAGMNGEARANFWQEKTGFSSEVIYNLTDYWSLSLAAEKMWVDDRKKDDAFHDYYLSATVSRAQYGSFNLSWEASSLDSDEENNKWLSGELALTAAKNHHVLIFYGRERSGLKCSSGVCRPVQPFEGFRIMYDGRFNLEQ